MQDVWIAADSMVSPLGFTSEENYKQIIAGKSGIDILQTLASEKVYAGWIQKSLPQYSDAVTRFEAMSFLSVENALKKTELDPSSNRVVFILSSTKGNIELLEKGNANDERIHLHKTARIIAEYFGNKETPVVVSNACISA